MQFFGADERTVSGNSPSLLYPGTFTWEKSDGTTEEITVPGSYDVPAGETMVITSTLSADFDASSIAIRSSLQDVNILHKRHLKRAVQHQQNPSDWEKFRQPFHFLLHLP